MNARRSTATDRAAIAVVPARRTFETAPSARRAFTLMHGARARSKIATAETTTCFECSLSEQRAELAGPTA
jgi:hypothetical protein